MTLPLLAGFFICKEGAIPRHVASRCVDFSIGELGEVVIAIPKLSPAYCLLLYAFVILGRRIMPPINTTKTASHAERMFIKIPPVINPTNEHVATKSA